jgi:hypothetical protein
MTNGEGISKERAMTCKRVNIGRLTAADNFAIPVIFLHHQDEVIEGRNGCRQSKNPNPNWNRTRCQSCCQVELLVVPLELLLVVPLELELEPPLDEPELELELELEPPLMRGSPQLFCTQAQPFHQNQAAELFSS